MDLATVLDAEQVAGLRSFLTVCGAHDWRCDPSGLSGASAALLVEGCVIHEMQRRQAILHASELVNEFSAIVELQSCPELKTGLDWFVDILLVKQVGRAVKDIIKGELKNFECASVPDDMFWRKNASKDWTHHCLPDRYGWFSDSA